MGQELQSFATPAISDLCRANRKGFSDRDWRFPEKFFCIREQATLRRRQMSGSGRPLLTLQLVFVNLRIPNQSDFVFS
jgi:hypothetical protein